MSAPATSAFVSYSSADSDFALQLAKDLKAAGAKVWLDQLDIRPGYTWDNAIEDAIEVAPQMLIVLSPASVRSENVRDEISRALRQRKIIIPVLFQDCIVPLRLERIQHIDFRASYATGLAALLRQLDLVQPEPSIVQPPPESIAKPPLETEPESAPTADIEPLFPSEKAAPEQPDPAPRPDWKKKAELTAMQRAQQQEQQLREAARERERRLREQAQAEITYAQPAFAIQRAEPSPASRPHPVPPASRQSSLPRWLKVAVIPAGALAACLGVFLFPKSASRSPTVDAPITSAIPSTASPTSQSTIPPPANPAPSYAPSVDAPRQSTLPKPAGETNPQQKVPLTPSASPLNLSPAPYTLEGAEAEKAAVKYQQLCDGGNYYTCGTLGYSYELGKGVPRDPVKANALYKQSCDGGSGSGCAMLAMNYRSGLGLSIDLEKAHTLFVKSCKLGSQIGCDELKKQ